MSRFAKRLTIFAALAVICGLGLLALQARQQTHTLGVVIGESAPAFTLPMLGGGTVSLQQLRGKPVYVNFFTSFCQACRNEAPSIEAVHRYFGNRVAIVEVDLSVSEPSLTAVRQYKEQFGLQMPIALDRSGAVADHYGVSQLPVSVFIGPQGKVRAVATQEMSFTQMRSELQPLLAKGS